MKIEHHRWYSQRLHRDMNLLAFGHWGAPMIAFPSSMGSYVEWRDQKMIDALAGHIEAGQLKVYTVASCDRENWYHDTASTAYRAHHYSLYEQYILQEVLPFIHSTCGGHRPTLAGTSFGAYHAVNLYLRNPLAYAGAIGMSGVYSLEFLFGKNRDESVYFHSPLDYARNFWRREDLDPLRFHGGLSLFNGQGPFENHSLPSTLELSGILRSKGIHHNLEIWGHDVKHDWPWWRKQIVHAANSGYIPLR